MSTLLKKKVECFFNYGDSRQTEILAGYLPCKLWKGRNDKSSLTAVAVPTALASGYACQAACLNARYDFCSTAGTLAIGLYRTFLGQVKSKEQIFYYASLCINNTLIFGICCKKRRQIPIKKIIFRKMNGYWRPLGINRN